MNEIASSPMIDVEVLNEQTSSSNGFAAKCENKRSQMLRNREEVINVCKNIEHGVQPILIVLCSTKSCVWDAPKCRKSTY